MPFCEVAGFLIIAVFICGYLWEHQTAPRDLRTKREVFMATAETLKGGHPDQWLEGYAAGVKASLGRLVRPRRFLTFHPTEEKSHIL